MSKYLYGAAVQGIQEFIFRTNDLQEIIGGSELVNYVGGALFEEFLGDKFNESSCVQRAAGNIKYVFDKREDCAVVVKNYPKLVQSNAPGITFSQAVVEYDGERFAEAVEELEGRLRIQRNKPAKSLTMGLLGIQRSRRTGLPAVKQEPTGNPEEYKYYDEATVLKKNAGNERSTLNRLSKAAFGAELPKYSYAFKDEDLCAYNGWFAIIHADGNGLGKIVQEIGKDRKVFSDFSKGLDCATQQAAQQAFIDIAGQFNFKINGKVGIRPVIVGGDDFTVMCSAEYALPYMKSYLKHFEDETKKLLCSLQIKKFPKLTACAGIAFIHEHMPFYYGYNMAEMLCEAAKKDAKNSERTPEDGIAPSCLLFHMVQDDFVTSYDDIIRRELSPTDTISYQYGPYYLENQANRSTIDMIMSLLYRISQREANPVKTGLRRWQTIIADKKVKEAKQLLDRMRKVATKDNKALIEDIMRAREDNGMSYYIINDLHELNSVVNKVTK